MTNYNDLNKILEEYYAEKDPSNRLREWVRDTLINSKNKQLMTAHSASSSYSYRNCWIVFEPHAECFFISREEAKVVLNNPNNFVQLTLDDYLTESFGVASLSNMRNQILLTGPEITEIVDSIVEDLHGWCSLLDGVRQSTNA